MKKKILVTMLVLTMLMTACTRSTESVSGEVTTSEEATVEAVEEEVVEEETVEEADSEESDAEETEADADEEFYLKGTSNEEESGEAEEVDVSQGSFQGGVYSNTFLNIGCEFDEEWTIASEEELLAMTSNMLDVLDKDSYKKALEEYGMAYDLYASRNQGFQTVNITLENMGVVFGTLVTVDAVVESSKGQIEETLSDLGAEDITSEVITRNFLGQDQAGLKVTGNYQGVPMYEQLVCIKVGNYLAVITAASFNEDITDEILDNFYALQ